MFTGIVETTGIVTGVEKQGSNLSFWMESTLSDLLKIDQSVSHSGVCLTVEAVEGNRHRVTAVDKTLQKTNIGQWQPGSRVNIERCLPINGRLDGHMVQGHVDTVANCVYKSAENGSWLYRFQFPESFAHLIIEKGSICLNGISLTIFNIGRNEFSVAIIPYTYQHTNIHQIEPGNWVNIEFDILGKYMARWRELGG